MTWARLDDGFHSNPKVLQAGNAASGLYARALSYCGDHLTDGFLPSNWAKAAGSAKECRTLEAVELWERVEGGYRIPDYLDFNPSKEKVLAERESRRQRGRLGAEKRWADSSSLSNGHSTSQASALASSIRRDDAPGPSPTRPLKENGQVLPGEDRLGWERADAIGRLLAVLTDKDAGTEKRVWLYAARLPAPTIHKVRESLLDARARGEVHSSASGYAVNALKDELRGTEAA